jgi:hypothetical protein
VARFERRLELAKVSLTPIARLSKVGRAVPILLQCVPALGLTLTADTLWIAETIAKSRRVETEREKEFSKWSVWRQYHIWAELKKVGSQDRRNGSVTAEGASREVRPSSGGASLGLRQVSDGYDALSIGRCCARGRRFLRGIFSPTHQPGRIPKMFSVLRPRVATPPFRDALVALTGAQPYPRLALDPGGR